MTISQIVRSGTIELDPQNSVIIIKETGKVVPYTDIKPIDRWGIVYEKFVGQLYESEGYKVEYRMSLGYRDRGIDLICENDTEIIYIQCKFWNSWIGHNALNNILYTASSFLYKQENKGKKQYFVLITPDKEINFRRKGRKYNYPGPYPGLEYFMQMGNMQDKMKVKYREVRMDI